MSNLEPRPLEAECGGTVDVAVAPVQEVLVGREVVLGGTRAMAVTRTLPHKNRRMVGAWCFLDHFGPDDVSDGPGMMVPPHPHAGLQTVTWLVEGEVHHRDSLGSSQFVRPGQLNLMTAGPGIAHSEQSPPGRSSTLHGLQLWVALPDPYRSTAPAFEHHKDLPVLREPGVTTTVFMGTLGSATSPATIYSPLVGAEVRLDDGATARLPLDQSFEHAVLAVSGAVEVDGVALSPGSLIYLGSGRSAVEVASDGPGRALLIGGEPFEEQIVMWWNFIGRSHDEIVQAREEWMRGVDGSVPPGWLFGEVTGFDGAALPAPALPATPLKARGRVR
jgi:redox-sensitive bicupin YhaK (pirin superfamily)